MNESFHAENDAANGDLIDLAAGQTPFAEGVRLRLALFFDRKQAAEYAQLRRLRKELRSLGTISDIPPAPLWPDAAPAARPLSTPTVTWGKFTMKRRNVLAAYAVLLLTMTGIAVARQWVNSGVYAQFVDAGRTWKLSGAFGGKAILRNADGKIIGEYTHPDTSQIDAPLNVAVAGLTTAIHGAGNHTIADKSGRTLGTIVLSPVTDIEIADLNWTSEKRQRELAARYADGVRFPMGRNDNLGEGSTMSLPGLINHYDRKYGIALKLRGYSGINAHYPDFPLDIPIGESNALRKIPYPDGADAMRSFAPPRAAVPVLYWTLADKPKGEKRYPVENGWWKSVRQTGTFRGYGKHEIRDESGKLFVTLTITPLKAK